jgi:hypothetical protein
MKRYALLFGMALAGIGWAYASASAQEYSPERPAYCETGFTFVQVVEYKEIEHKVCKRVPDKRTKWVYCSKPGDYCLSPLCGRHHRDDCDSCCQDCKGPYCRKLLLKKKVEWECGTKCVVETVKEKVPCTVWRKVPIGTEKSVPSQAPESLPPPNQNTATGYPSR